LLTSLYNNILLKILSAEDEAAANSEFTESHHGLKICLLEKLFGVYCQKNRVPLLFGLFSTMDLIFIISETDILNYKERSKGPWLQRSFGRPSPGRDESTATPTQTLGPATILVKETNKITNFFKPTYFRDGMRVAT
jgi:hypothetical protein